MWISRFAIRNTVTTTALTLGLVIFGCLALVLLETDEFPDVDPPVVSVTVPYPGASPRDVEREVVDPIENAIAAITGVEEVSSRALDGFALIVVEFDFEKDLQEATQDIRDAVSEIRADLPAEMEELVLTRFDPNDLPIVSLTLSSPKRSARDLTRLADPELVGALRAIPGVANVELVGGLQRELTVELWPHALEAAGLTVSEVVQALQAANLAAPVGRVTARLQEDTIRLLGRPERPADFADLLIREHEGKVVRLGDVATVRDGHEEPRTTTLFNGEAAVGIDIIMAAGHSTTTVSERVRARVGELGDALPADVELRIVRDAGERVERSVRGVQRTLLEGITLTVVVVFLFLSSWRSTVITGLALPVSLLSAFIAVWAFGFTLNTMSLLGLTLAIGVLIDDAIVVRENIVRHMEQGKPHARAALEGTAEIGLAVSATTFSIVVVFIPIAFMGGLAQQWFAPFALTIASAVLVSLLVAFSLDPMLSAHWADPEVEGGARSLLTRRLQRFNAVLNRQTVHYRRIIDWALRHRIATLGIAVASFIGALAMPALGLVGSEFFPREDRSELTIMLETPPGSSLSYTQRKAMQAARMARERPEVAYTYTRVGGEGGAVDEASIYVRLLPRRERRMRQDEVEDTLRASLRRIAGMRAWLSAGGFAPRKQIEIQITGPDIEVLTSLAEQVAEQVAAVPGAVDVGLSTKGDRPELVVSVDRDLARAVGVTVAQVAAALRPAFAGLDAGDWVDPEGDTRDVWVRLAPEARQRAADLERLPLLLPGSGGARMVPLGQVATVRRVAAPAVITRLDRQRVVTVGANTEGRALSEVAGGIRSRLADLPLPAAYAIREGGQTETQREVFTRMLVALLSAVLLMYLVLVIQFESFLDPVAILASLPLSLIGVMLALLITGDTINLMSMIGIVLLTGIVVKNAILLIDFAKWAQRAGKERRAAIVEAGAVRLRPILMTSVAIIAGMTPVAIGLGEGADFRAPLGRAVIGGVVASTVLTLLIIPTVYDILAGWRDGLLGRARRARRQKTNANTSSG